MSGSPSETSPNAPNISRAVTATGLNNPAAPIKNISQPSTPMPMINAITARSPQDRESRMLSSRKVTAPNPTQAATSNSRIVSVTITAAAAS